jgi:hypothetical protein
MNVAGHPIPLSNAAQAQRGGGAGIGGVALNDQEATREAILTQMIGDARADDAPLRSTRHLQFAVWFPGSSVMCGPSAAPHSNRSRCIIAWTHAWQRWLWRAGQRAWKGMEKGAFLGGELADEALPSLSTPRNLWQSLRHTDTVPHNSG